MTCPNCGSIWVRGDKWLAEGDRVWTRNVKCGDCGGQMVMRVTLIAQGPNDAEATQARHENGGLSK